MDWPKGVMKILQGSQIKLFFIFMVIVISLLIFFGEQLSLSDVEEAEIRTFLSANIEVTGKVGDIQKISMSKVVSVGQAGKKMPYRMYTLYVQGNKSTTFVRVRVDDPVKDGMGIKLSILSVD